MNCKQLGNHFDIHGGGSDLMFPHHENEIAQSTCAHDGQYVNYWMHSGMVMVDREKMSKSLGNFFTVRDVLKYYDAETVRYFLMSGHYRSQLNYSEENLKQARAALERLYTALRGTDKTVAPAGGEAFEARFIEAMDDDFNTPEAYSVLFDMAREVNRLKAEDMAAANAMASHLRKLSAVLGLLEQEPEAFLQSGAQADDSEVAEIEALIQQRLDARKAKDWAAADAARDRLNEMGIVLEDGPQGTTGVVSNCAVAGCEFSHPVIAPPQHSHKHHPRQPHPHQFRNYHLMPVRRGVTRQCKRRDFNHLPWSEKRSSDHGHSQPTPLPPVVTESSKLCDSNETVKTASSESAQP